MRRFVIALLLLSFPVPVARAQSARPAQRFSPEKPQSPYDKIWRPFTEWYVDDSNPVVQKILFTGRFQYDFAAIDADQGNLHERNVRRLRLGHRVTLFRTLTVHGEVELNPQERDPVYVRSTDAYVQWSKSGSLALTLGKQSVPFTMDGSTSSKDLLTIDRSNLTNNIWFPYEYIPGLSVSGRRAPWIYRAGVYSAGAATRQFGEFSGGVFTLGVLGYDFAKSIGVKEALLAANYVYQHPDADNTFTRPLEHIVSVNFNFDAGRWGLRTDLSAASGYLGQRDLWSVMAMPFATITDTLQLVGRYTVLQSDEGNGVRLATYESRLVPGRGDRYNEVYLGANYFFYAHKLKLQSGVQFADMRDRARDGGAYSGVSGTAGLRVGW